MKADNFWGKQKDERRKIKSYRWFSHFSQRLYERYGFFVTYEEWLSLCNSDYTLLKKAKGFLHVVIVVNETEVVAIKEDTKYGYLRTALPDIRNYLKNI